MIANGRPRAGYRAGTGPVTKRRGKGCVSSAVTLAIFKQFERNCLLQRCFQMRSSGEGSSLVGAWRMVAPAVAAAVLVQCSAAPPPPAPTSPPSVATPSPAAATIQPVTAADLGPSWHPGCPIDPPHGGQLSGGDDELSMEDNNTRRITAVSFPAAAGGLGTHSVEPSISTRCSIPRSIGRVRSNPRPPRHTSTAAAQTQESCTRGMLRYASSPIVVGAGAVTGELPRTTSTLSGDLQKCGTAQARERR